MNAGFEDAMILYQFVKDALFKCGHHSDIDIPAIVKEFSEYRRPATDALADLCLEHYHDMASNTKSSLYLLGKRVDSWMTSIFAGRFMPLYSMIAFSNIPYHKAIEKSKRQEKFVRILGTSVLFVTVLGAQFLYLKFRKQK